jgi:hypothetical protein
MSPKFQLGRLVATPNAVLQLTQYDVFDALKRHQTGDWGNVDLHDRQENERSLKEGYRLLSVYQSIMGVKFWIITEADRSVTTVLMPEDY